MVLATALNRGRAVKLLPSHEPSDVAGKNGSRKAPNKVGSLADLRMQAVRSAHDKTYQLDLRLFLPPGKMRCELWGTEHLTPLVQRHNDLRRRQSRFKLRRVLLNALARLEHDVVHFIIRTKPFDEFGDQRRVFWLRGLANLDDLNLQTALFRERDSLGLGPHCFHGIEVPDRIKKDMNDRGTIIDKNPVT